MTPLWGTIPPTKGNQYYEAVNEPARRRSITVPDHATATPTATSWPPVLASAKDVPDWVCIPTWNLPPRFGSEVVENALPGPHPVPGRRQGQAVPEPRQHPHRRLEVLRLQRQALRPAVPRRGHHRRDLLPRGHPRRAAASPRRRRTARTLLDLAKELTGGERWGAEDLWNTRRDHPRVSRRSGSSTATSSSTGSRPTSTARRSSGTPRCSPAAPSTRTPSPTSRRRQDAVRVRQVAHRQRRRRRLARGPARQPGQQPRVLAAAVRPVRRRRRHAGALEGQPGQHLLLPQEDGRRGQDQGAPRDRQLPRRAVRHHRVRHHQQRRRGRALHHAATTACPVPTELAATELQPTYIFLVDPPISRTHGAVPGLRQGASARGRRTRPSTRRSRCSTRMQIVEPQQYASIGQPFVDLEKDISRGRKSHGATSTRRSRPGRRPAATSCGRSTRTSWTQQ